MEEAELPWGAHKYSAVQVFPEGHSVKVYGVSPFLVWMRGVPSLIFHARSCGARLSFLVQVGATVDMCWQFVNESQQSVEANLRWAEQPFANGACTHTSYFDTKTPASQSVQRAAAGREGFHWSLDTMLQCAWPHCDNSAPLTAEPLTPGRFDVPHRTHSPDDLTTSQHDTSYSHPDSVTHRMASSCCSCLASCCSSCRWWRSACRASSRSIGLTHCSSRSVQHIAAHRGKYLPSLSKQTFFQAKKSKKEGERPWTTLCASLETASCWLHPQPIRKNPLNCRAKLYNHTWRTRHDRGFIRPEGPAWRPGPRAWWIRDPAEAWMCNGVYSSSFRAKASGGHSKARETRDAQFLQKFTRFALITVTLARPRVCKCPPPQIPVSQSPF